MRPDALSGEDAAWLHMETPDNLMVVTGLLELATPIGRVQLERLIAQRLLALDRFTQRVVEPAARVGPLRWERDPELRLANHLAVLEPAPRSESELKAALSGLVSQPLDRAHPLWKIWFVPRYRRGSVLVARVHHAIADGFALLYVLLELCDSDHDGQLAVPPPSVSALRQAVQAIRQPWRAGRLLATIARFAGSLAGLIASPADSPTVLKGPLGIAKRVSWTRPVSVEELKTLARRHKATLNDVIVSAVSGALRRYLQSRDENPSVVLHAMVPVNLRSKQEALAQLGNQFGIVILPLPLHVADPARRLFEVKRRMDRIKRSPEAVVAMGLLAAMGLAPVPLERLLLAFFTPKASAVLTNVPGPRRPLSLGGRKISRLLFWVPQSGRLAVGISSVSYAGNLVVGVMTDARLVHDPDVISNGFEQELAALGAHAAVLQR